LNWYYAHENKQNGPHPEEAIRDLARAGVINAQTSVWREGMADWQPLAQAAPHLLAPGAPPTLPSASPDQASCGECGRVFPVSEMVQIQQTRVCAWCKPAYLQKMREGAPTGGRAVELERLLKVAKAQRGVIIGILLSLLCYAILGFDALSPSSPDSASWLPLLASLGLIVVVVFQVICVYRLASALNCGAPIGWVLGVMFLSCIGLLLLLSLSSKATKQLKAAGFKVGLLGGDPREIERAMVG
jgi:hypothetical protein